jgi:hypothetical protein
MREFIHHDFSIGFPDRWIDTSVIALAGPPDKGFSPSITIMRERLEFRLKIEEHAANQLAVLREQFAENDYEVVNEGEIQLGEVPAYQRTHEFDVTEDIRARQMQVYVIKGDDAITITCTSTDEGFDDSKALFLKAVREFRWRL